MLGAVFQPLTHSLRTLSSVACDLVRLLVLVSRSRRALASKNLFLRKQLALFQERKAKPHRADDSTRLIMVILGRRFAWRDALVNVRPDTFVRRVESEAQNSDLPTYRRQVPPQTASGAHA